MPQFRLETTWCNIQMLERDRQMNMLVSDGMFRSLISNIQDFAIFIVDAGAVILTWNAGAARITGFQADEVIGKPVSLLSLPEPAAIDLFQQGFSGDKCTRLEETRWCLRKDGSQYHGNVIIRPLEERSGVELYSYQLLDVTEATKLQEIRDTTVRAQARESEFRNLADTSPNMIWSCDAEGNCIYVNNRWTEYTGYTLQETLGFGWLAAVHPSDQQRATLLWHQSVKTGETFDIELRIKDNNGNFKWFKSRAMLIEDEQKGPTGWVGACTDIDEQKKIADTLEAAIEARTAQLAQLNKDLQLARDRALEASALKSRFVANISHEIRTPMSGVLGMSELLLTCKLEDDAKELAQYIYTSARSLLDVVNDLLDFSKLEAGKLTIARMRFSLLTVIEEAKQSTAVTASQKGLAFDLAVQPQLPDVYGDPVRIRQVLLNLIHNAIKFTGSGGIKVTLEETARSKNSITVRFVIEDSGIGIADEASKHLFNPFEQADGSTTRRYGGTGLGLSISKNLVKLMLGEIGFNSVEGKGSSFWFSIPLEIA